MKSGIIALRDILREIEFLHSIRNRETFETFNASAVDVRAASYSIMVISEAVRRVPAAWLDEYPDRPWHAVRTIGNKLRHEYQRVSTIILWGIVADHADALKTTVESMIERCS